MQNPKGLTLGFKILFNMPDKTYSSPEKIQDILSESSRLRFLLTERYGLKLSKIDSIRVDSDNHKIDIRSGDTHLRFKAKGTDAVLMKDPETGIMKMVFDPALAQGVLEIVHDHA